MYRLFIIIIIIVDVVIAAARRSSMRRRYGKEKKKNDKPRQRGELLYGRHRRTVKKARLKVGTVLCFASPRRVIVIYVPFGNNNL